MVPRFASIFDDGRMKIPLPTQIMLQASKVVQDWWLARGCSRSWWPCSAFRYLHRAAPKGGLWWDDARLKIPLLGDALRKAETSRFARAMSTLVANTVPLVQSLHISAGILFNKRMANSLKDVAQGVKRGEGISGPLARTGMFPPLASHLLTVGEETGKLDVMFAAHGGHLRGGNAGVDQALHVDLRAAGDSGHGLIVGALILSMLLAITSINDVAI